VIALHSPRHLLETVPLRQAREKARAIPRCNVIQSIFSGPVPDSKFANWRAFHEVFKKTERISLYCRLHGGEGGIRTPGTLSGTPVFKTGAINHSATSPASTVLLQAEFRALRFQFVAGYLVPFG
jgi:hypothetical protein